MEKLNEKQVLEKVDTLATDEFLTSLTTIARLYGWESDYTEVCYFLSWIYKAKGITEPDLNPFGIDDFDNTIIP